MFGYIGHCAASIFEAIREPVFFCGFLFLLCFIAHLYKANGVTDMEVLGLFRPCFFTSHSGRLRVPISAIRLCY